MLGYVVPESVCEDEAEVYARSHRTVQTVLVHREQPVRLQRQPERLAYGVLHSDKRVYGEERLLVVDCRSLRQPVMLVALEHVERRLHAAAHRSTDVWIEFSDLPEAVCEDSGPEQLVEASALHLLLQAHGREISFESGAEVLRKVEFRYSAYAERGP